MHTFFVVNNLLVKASTPVKVSFKNFGLSMDGLGQKTVWDQCQPNTDNRLLYYIVYVLIC